MQKDDVRLEINNRTFTGWTGVSIDMAVDQLADAFSVSAPFDPDRADLRDAFRPFGYQPVKVYIGDDLLITGRIEKVEHQSDAGDRVLTVQGRSLTGALVDCSIDGELEFSGLALSTIARKIAGRFGVSVRADNDTNSIEVARAEYGQTAADFLLGLANARHLFLNSSYDGKLVISWGASFAKKSAAAALVEGRAPLLSVSTSFDGTGRFSVYKVATQFAGMSDIMGEAKDAGVPIYRPHLRVVSDVDSDNSFMEAGDVQLIAALQKMALEKAEKGADSSARRVRSEAMVKSFSVSARVAGWRRPDGKRWAERQTVTLKAPGAALYTECQYLIAGVSYKLDESDGQVVDLRLVFPETYAGGMPEVLPWE